MISFADLRSSVNPFLLASLLVPLLACGRMEAKPIHSVMAGNVFGERHWFVRAGDGSWCDAGPIPAGGDICNAVVVGNEFVCQWHK